MLSIFSWSSRYLEICIQCVFRSITGNIRLVGGNTIFEGRVEIYHDGIWGTMCEAEIENLDLVVICASIWELR